MAKTSLIAEVKYESDRGSWGKVMSEGKSLAADWRKQVTREAGQTTTTVRTGSDPALAAQLAALKGQILSAGAPVAQMASEMRARILSNLTGGGVGMRPDALHLRQIPHPPMDRRILSNINAGADATARLSKEQQRLAQSGRNSGMGILELSRALEDAQYGMRGVLNNIPGIIQSFGGTAALAGQLSIIAVAASVVASTWDNTFVKAGRGGIFGNLFGDQDDAAASLKMARLKEMIAGREELARRAEETTKGYGKELDDSNKKQEESSRGKDREVDALNRLAAAENEINEARIEAMEGSRRSAAAAENRWKVEEEALKRRAAMLDAQQMQDAQIVVNSEKRTADMKAQLDAIKGTSAIVGRNPDGSAIRKDAFTPQEEQDRKGLQQRLDDEKKFREDTLQRMRGNSEGRGEVNTDRGVNNARLSAAMERVKQLEEKERLENLKKLTEFFDSLKSAVGAGAARMKEAAAALEENARAIKATREDAETAHLRARGRGAAANRREARTTERRRKEELEAQGFSAEEAADMAGRERRDARGSGGGAGPARKASGLDGFDFNQKGFRPQTPALDRGRADRAARPTAAEKAAGKDGEGGLTEALKAVMAPVVDLLKQIKTASEKSPADKLANAPK